MLPTSLSNGICSLNEGEDRLALSCIMNVDKKGKVTSYKIKESIIRSDRRMTYSDVNRILGKHDKSLTKKYKKLVPMFELMEELSQILSARRHKRGSIEFDFTESHIVLDEQGIPVGIEPYERGVSNHIIEEFMLLANETVAKDAMKKELPFVYRVHGEPDGEKIAGLKRLAAGFGYTIHSDKASVSPKELQRFLKKLSGKPEEYMLSVVTLRSMQQAMYSTECDGHFGLASEHYCHFTSPIRRYPDLIIHRIIKENKAKKLRKKRRAYYDGLLAPLAGSLSKLERRAEEVEREVEKLKKVQYMSAHIGEHYTGIISGVTKWGIYVALPDTIEGMIPLSSMHGDRFEFDEDSYRIVGTYTGKTYTLGESIDIIVERADIEKRQIDFFLPGDHGLKEQKAHDKKRSKKPSGKKDYRKNSKRKSRYKRKR